MVYVHGTRRREGEKMDQSLFTGPPAVINGFTPAPERARTSIEETYLSLRQEILNGALPQGSKLHLEGLRARHGISTTTVREALTRLIGDRLVVAEGQKGFRVAPMSLADLEDLTYARMQIECLALADSVRHGDDEWEVRVVAAYHRLGITEDRLRAAPALHFDTWERQNMEFHAALVSGARSQWLERMRMILFHNSERYRRLSATKGPPPLKVRDEHTAIFEAAIRRDAEAAVEAMRVHIERAFNVIKSAHLLPESGGGAALPASRNA